MSHQVPFLVLVDSALPLWDHSIQNGITIAIKYYNIMLGITNLFVVTNNDDLSFFFNNC